MTMTTTEKPSLAITSLPPLGSVIEGGTFAGLTTNKDGIHCAAVLLPGTATEMTWKKAMNWAKKQDGELPTRPVASLLFANAKASLPSGWHWTSEEYDASFAWSCYFDDGLVGYFHKSFEGSAVAVRLIPVTA
jgi:hypothetical protein